MHKYHASHELAQAIQSLKGYSWILEKSNHTRSEMAYAHHVRDRLSEAIVVDIAKTINLIDRIKDAIENDLDNEGDWDGAPF